jgi:Ser/Thr protein kinase RdoA (MazF antagonist)
MNELVSPDLIREVLAAWNIMPGHVSLISAKGNLHWRVQSGRDAFVLRMYKRPQTIASIQYELDILTQVNERRWPVAAAIDGIVQHSGIPFALFPFLPGNPCRQDNEQQSRRRGRILAELHQELETLANSGQRDGWQRADEVVQPRGGTWLRDCTASANQAELVQSIVRQLEGIHDRLCASGASQFPEHANHGDLTTENLLFDRGVLSGVLDFDSAHLDLRAADLACARRSRNDDVVRGYMEVVPLSGAELDCLPDLWRASVLRYALQLLDRESRTDRCVSELGWCMKQLGKTRPFGS